MDWNTFWTVLLQLFIAGWVLALPLGVVISVARKAWRGPQQPTERQVKL